MCVNHRCCDIIINHTKYIFYYIKYSFYCKIHCKIYLSFYLYTQRCLLCFLCEKLDIFIKSLNLFTVKLEEL